eukprot:TRINITY_DN33215_c0_g1_i1.p2 TRINITY_DN33215_c0_g1~~TRINITY_DN33215_c0_g1_i1.p2  ORF type:complete len:111 (+),score=14.33 TRINITY_DN33215_c0_g1_i1:226-558(+)
MPSEVVESVEKSLDVHKVKEEAEIPVADREKQTSEQKEEKEEKAKEKQVENEEGNKDQDNTSLQTKESNGSNNTKGERAKEDVVVVVGNTQRQNGTTNEVRRIDVGQWKL